MGVSLISTTFQARGKHFLSPYKIPSPQSPNYLYKTAWRQSIPGALKLPIENTAFLISSAITDSLNHSNLYLGDFGKASCQQKIVLETSSLKRLQKYSFTNLSNSSKSSKVFFLLLIMCISVPKGQPFCTLEPNHFLFP